VDPGRLARLLRSGPTRGFYKVTAAYAPHCDKGIAFDDPDLAIAWPISASDAVLSDRDRRHPRLRDLPAEFTYQPPEPG
jgi:dTDP-4-dehydrorhamnose 3,5-epimerase